MAADWISNVPLALADASFRAALLGAIVAGVLMAVRVRSAAVTHAAWASVVCAMLLMPVLPRWIPALSYPMPVPWRPAEAGVPLESSERSLPPRGPVGAAAPLPASDAPAPRVSTPRAAIDPMWVVLALYALAAGFLFVRMAAGLAAMRRIRRTAAPVEGSSFHESPAVLVPMTVGLVAPAVVLPVEWRAWPDDKLQAVLAHERAHVARRDTVVRLLAHVNRAVFWFHPLAWWLERTLAATAEDACDDVAIGRVGEPRRYAEVLLDMAAAVRRNRGRIAWAGMGVDGNGLLGRRIDRVLRGDVVRDMSRSRKALVTLGCVVAILAVAGWRYQRAPLRENPEVTAREARRQADQAFRTAARNMGPAQVAEVEAAWRDDPRDFTALEKILIYHGHDFSGSRPANEREIIEARRRYILWLIEQHPEHELAGTWLARIFRTPLDPLPDPEGYDEARRLWLMHADRSDAGTAVLSHAALFFEANDKPLAERMLLRAQALEPKPEWSSRLGRLYAITIMGANSSMPLNVLRTVSVEDSRGTFALEVRRKLEVSADPRLLESAASYLVNARQFFTSGRARLDFDPVALGASYLKRVLELDPASRVARARLASLDEREGWQRLREPLRDAAGRIRPRHEWPDIVASLADRHRFELMPHLADEDYSFGEHLDFTAKDAAGAAAAWSRSKEYARRTLAMSSMFTDHPDHGPIVFRTHLALGTHALREGNRRLAVQHLLEAARAPGPTAFSPLRGLSLESKLVHYLLKEGERESVIEFLETSARIRPDDRERLLKDAASIRRGEMPETFQLRLARGH